MDTPIFDGVLGDRLQQARAVADRAETEARAFTAALSTGQAGALEQLAAARAERLVEGRTALLTARVTALETQVRRLQDEAVRTAAQAQAELEAALPAPPEAAAAPAPAPPPVRAPAPAPPPPVPAHAEAGTPPPDAPVAARPGRKAADQGPTGEDVPAVPSMKDIFASSRAAGWLDSLLGAKR